MKPKKRIKIMVDGIFGLPKGSILTYNETAGYYFDKDDKAYKKAYIEDLGEILAQQISADGYILEELKYKRCEVFQPDSETWTPFIPTTKLINFHFVRLRKEPEFIPVPENIRLNTNAKRGFIFNKSRVLYLDGNDKLPSISKSVYTPQPHQIDTRELEEFEDGQIYFAIAPIEKIEYFGLNSICFYWVYCEKEKRMYFFNHKDSYNIDNSRVDMKNLESFRKVIPARLTNESIKKSKRD